MMQKVIIDFIGTDNPKHSRSALEERINKIIQDGYTFKHFFNLPTESSLYPTYLFVFDKDNTNVEEHVE